MTRVSVSVVPTGVQFLHWQKRSRETVIKDVVIVLATEREGYKDVVVILRDVNLILCLPATDRDLFFIFLNIFL